MPKEGICPTPPPVSTDTTSSRNPARRLATPSRISAEFAREFFCLTFMGLVAATVARRVQKVVPSAFITIKMAACFCREEGNYGEGVLALLDCFARLERGKGEGEKNAKIAFIERWGKRVPSLPARPVVVFHSLPCSYVHCSYFNGSHSAPLALSPPLFLHGRPAARSSSNVDRARYNLAERYFVFFLLCSVFDPSFFPLPLSCRDALSASLSL